MLWVGGLNLLELSVFFTSWTALYFGLCRQNPGRSKEWHCRTVTVLHALAISVMAIYSTFWLGPWPWTDAGGPNTPFQIHTCCLCLGYFIFDITWCLYYQTEGPIMLAHHILSIFGLSVCLVLGKYGTEMVATIGGAELTNPLLQLRWFIKELGYYNTVFGDVIDLAFLLSFGFFRIYLGTILLYRYYMQPTDSFGRFGGTCIYVIGWLFFISIVNFAIHKYTKRFQRWRASRSRRAGRRDEKSTSDSYDDLNGKTSDEDPAIIREKEIPTQREIKHRDRTLALRKNCVVKESL